MAPSNPLDVELIRNGEIKLHGLHRADREYTFYHDETNNIRKLRINTDGLNVAELKVFVLGGVVHAGPRRPLDIAPLRDALRIQPSVRDLKLQHVAKGEFLEVLQSPKLTAFLRWLAASDLLVQYQELDPLYWSIVDIIDSILQGREELSHLIRHHAHLKSDLAEILRTDLPSTIALFGAFGYPSLRANERTPFLQALLILLERNQSAVDPFNYMMLKGVIQAGRGLDSLVFIEDNVRHVLIDEFATFYRSRVILFKHSRHIFDEEDTVRDNLLAVPLVSGGAPFSNFSFAKSDNEPGIQVSDIVVGLLGKMHSYFTETPADEVSEARDTLAGASLKNALLLRDLIAASHDENIAFQHHVASLYDRDKADRFLRFEDGSYAD